MASIVVEKVKRGDPAAARLVFGFFAPPRERRVNFELRPVETVEGAAAAVGDVLEAVAAGDIALSEADRILSVIRSMIDVLSAATSGGPESQQTYRSHGPSRFRRADREISRADEKQHANQPSTVAAPLGHEPWKDGNPREGELEATMYFAKQSGDAERYAAAREEWFTLVANRLESEL